MIWLNDVLIPAPSKLDITSEKKVHTERGEDGRIRMVPLGRKYTITLEYSSICGESLLLTLSRVKPRNILCILNPATNEMRAFGACIATHTPGSLRDGLWSGVQLVFVEARLTSGGVVE